MSGWAMAGAAAGSALSNILGGVISSAMQANQAEKLQKNAQDFAVKMMLKGPALTMKGLDRAGLNPILAVAGGMPNIPGPSGIPSTPMPDIGVDVGEAISSAKEAKTFKDVTDRIANESATSHSQRRTARHHVDIAEQHAYQEIENTQTARHLKDRAAQDARRARYEADHARWRVPKQKVEGQIYSIGQGSLGTGLSIAKDLKGLVVPFRKRSPFIHLINKR